MDNVINIYNDKQNFSKKIEKIRKYISKYTFDVKSRLNTIKISLDENNEEYNSKLLYDSITEVKRNKLQGNVIKKISNEKKMNISNIVELFMKNLKEEKTKKRNSALEKLKKSISIKFLEKNHLMKKN